MAIQTPERPPTYMPEQADAAAPASLALVAGEDRDVFVVVGDLTVTVEESDGEFIASEVRTGMYGEGDDGLEAVLNLLRSLDVLRQELRGHDGPLSPELAADLAYLDERLWR